MLCCVLRSLSQCCLAMLQILDIHGGPDAAVAAVVSSLQQVSMYMLRRLYKLTTDLQVSPCPSNLMCVTSEYHFLYCGIIGHIVAAYRLKQERRQISILV